MSIPQNFDYTTGNKKKTNERLMELPLSLEI